MALSRDTHIGPLSLNLARSVIVPTWLAQDHDREAGRTSEGAAHAGFGAATSRHRSGRIRWRRSPQRRPRGPAPIATGGHNFAIQSGPRRSAACSGPIYLSRDTLGELATKGEIRPVIDRTYALDDIVDAHRYVDKGHKRGNAVITVP
jgi:hypothetical protein